MLSITWLDPRTDPSDEPLWAVWETECGMYRITYNAKDDTYDPCVVEPMKQNDRTTHIQLRSISVLKHTLEAAQDVINHYHCERHNLTLA